TPIANLKMINSTLLENEVPVQKQKEFLTAQASQLDKLDFLMQMMIKTSRLEAGVISLEKKSQPLYDTLAAALGGILLNAEKKQINVQVDCPENLVVKYTPEGGQIRVSVESWEMYVKIDIADTGIGISEQHQGAIFKRFYREDIVHDVDGIGIGLYLAREIVTLQGGYIRVTSEVGRGSTFSVFLPRQ
ncbi:MAG: sensor histidine kinase, partial [[Eubacterium] rectale]|nr:sensor histidine kinase [Agathobacter rectalis]